MHKALSSTIVAIALGACHSGPDDPPLAPASVASSPARGTLAQPTTRPGSSDTAAAPAPVAARLDATFPPSFDACDLIPAEEAADVAGAPVRKPQSRWGARNVTCLFHPQDGDSSWPGAVYIEVSLGEDDYDEILERGREVTASQGETIEMLDDVGDRAFYVTIHGHNIVFAAKGHTANLIVRDDPAADNRERAIDLARRVIQRLP